MTEQEAVEFAKTEWWKDKPLAEVAEFQIHEPLLCCPFEVFHEAIEHWLGRPVWTHEFADPQALIDEKQGKREFEGPLSSLKRVAPNKPAIMVIHE